MKIVVASDRCWNIPAIQALHRGLAMTTSMGRGDALKSSAVRNRGKFYQVVEKIFTTALICVITLHSLSLVRLNISLK
jgi:hypothetical protein